MKTLRDRVSARKAGSRSACPARSRAVAVAAEDDLSTVSSVAAETGLGHVAIIGLGPSLADYIEVAKRVGGRSAFCDEVWAINALGNVLECDRIFHMDDVRIQEIRAAASPQSNIASMLAWLKKHPGPIITSRAHPDYPGLVEFPLGDVINKLGCTVYFNNTAAYAIAYAMYLGATKISCFGLDYTYANMHDAERGRACAEFWLGVAAERGVALGIGEHSSLLDACSPMRERLYGYDTLDLTITRAPDGSARVERALREKLPTADEIERAYDHSRPANPLMRA